MTYIPDCNFPYDGSPPPGFEPGTFGCHEALYLASTFRTMFEEHWPNIQPFGPTPSGTRWPRQPPGPCQTSATASATPIAQHVNYRRQGKINSSAEKGGVFVCSRPVIADHERSCARMAGLRAGGDRSS